MTDLSVPTYNMKKMVSALCNQIHARNLRRTCCLFAAYIFLDLINCQFIFSELCCFTNNGHESQSANGTQFFQSFFLITDIATYRMNQPRRQII